MSNGKGTLYLIPVTLGGGDVAEVLPARTLSLVRQLTHFIVENTKSARLFLKAAQYPQPIQSVVMTILNEHTRAQDVPVLLGPLLQGTDCGLMSEAGCPAVADPGALLVRHAHEAGITVAPLTGPSSILLALMAGGLGGQRFAFHGYLPVAAEARRHRLRELERESEAKGVTQIFIETPYRNLPMVRAVLEHCRPDTLLCVAVDLTLPTEHIATRTIQAWKKNVPDLDRRPAIFLLYRHGSKKTA
jgi:16S rRNA (cytidine1402-2'-O)-methyltransferase